MCIAGLSTGSRTPVAGASASPPGHDPRRLRWYVSHFQLPTPAHPRPVRRHQGGPPLPRHEARRDGRERRGGEPWARQAGLSAATILHVLLSLDIRYCTLAFAEY